MKNIIPFKKDVIFKTNISEITSISLENTLNINNDGVKGDFIVSGDYKVTDTSVSVEPFEFKIPFEIVLDDRYDSSDALVDIDDFYYEITNNNSLSVSIDVLVDNLKEKPLVELEDISEVIPIREELAEKEDNRVVLEDNISLFNNSSFENETFVTYSICIIREGDTLESIKEKYSITEEELKKYNDIDELKLGDKLIIPVLYEGN